MIPSPVRTITVVHRRWLGHMSRNTSIEFRRDFTIGDHLVAPWSRVQPRIALSSGEAELYAGTWRISETQGFVHLMREFVN